MTGDQVRVFLNTDADADWEVDSKVTAGRFEFEFGTLLSGDIVPVKKSGTTDRFSTYCIELTDTISGGSMNWDVVDPVNNSGGEVSAVESDALKVLWQDQNAGEITDTTTAAAVQLLIWEIVYDGAAVSGGGYLNSSALSLTGGDFQVSTHTDYASIVSKANTILSGLDFENDPLADLYGMINDSQDQLFEGELVPLPSSALAGMAFLGMLALVRIRRKRQL